MEIHGSPSNNLFNIPYLIWAFCRSRMHMTNLLLPWASIQFLAPDIKGDFTSQQVA
jgi:hypothetical protein